MNFPVIQTLQNPFIVPDNLQSYWSFEENYFIKALDFKDYSGYDNYLESSTGGNQFIPGIYGVGLNIGNEGNNYMFGYPKISGYNNISISFWINTILTGRSGVITLGAYSSNSNGIALELNDGGSGYIQAVMFGSNVSNPITETPINDGTWHHIGFVVKTEGSSSIGQMYVDGRPNNVSVTYPYILAIDHNQIAVGYADGFEYSGGIDEIRYYNRSITDSEMYYLYFTARNLRYYQGLIGYWTGNGTTRDSSLYGNDGTWQGGGPTYVTGISGSQAFSFNGSDLVYLTNSRIWSFGYNDFTIVSWVNFQSLAGNQAFVSCDDIGGVTNEKWLFGYEVSSGNGLTFYMGFNGPPGSVVITGPSWTPTINTWYHVAVTRNADLFTLYLNGQSIYTQSEHVNIYTDPLYPLAIGSGNLDDGFQFDGYVQDVAIYNTGLSGDQILRIYNTGVF